jgi:putative ABC transport system ATP-binding protein
MSVVIRSLVKSYSLQTERLQILKSINAEIADAEIVAIVGASGSGKSTLLSLLAGLDRPDEGDIIIHGQSLNQLTARELIQFRAKSIGIVFQQFHLVPHLTAFENVALPLDILERPYNDAAILRALQDVGLEGRADHKPSELSGGESQRLALARALITQPRLLLADEPSGNLDSETGKKVMAVFFNQARIHRTTAILVTHDTQLAAQCDRQLVLKNGQFA